MEATGTGELENGSHGQLPGLPLRRRQLELEALRGVLPAVAKRAMVFDSISKITLFEAR